MEAPNIPGAYIGTIDILAVYIGIYCFKRFWTGPATLRHRPYSAVSSWHATICLVLGRAMAWQPKICKIAQSSLYSWTMYIIKEIKCCHLMLNSPATRWHPGFHFLLLNSAILHSCIYAIAVYIQRYLPFILDIHQFVNYFCWIVLVLYLSDVHVSWSTGFSQMACICHFVFFLMSCLEPPMGISSVGSFPVWSGGSLSIFPAL